MKCQSPLTWELSKQQLVLSPFHFTKVTSVERRQVTGGKRSISRPFTSWILYFPPSIPSFHVTSVKRQPVWACFYIEGAGLRRGGEAGGVHVLLPGLSLRPSGGPAGQHQAGAQQQNQTEETEFGWRNKKKERKVLRMHLYWNIQHYWLTPRLRFSTFLVVFNEPVRR